MAAKDDDLLKNCAIIRCISRLGQHRPLHGDGEQQTGQNRLKETSGNCFQDLGWWFGLDVWSDWIHSDYFCLC